MYVFVSPSTIKSITKECLSVAYVLVFVKWFTMTLRLEIIVEVLHHKCIALNVMFSQLSLCLKYPNIKLIHILLRLSNHLNYV